MRVIVEPTVFASALSGLGLSALAYFALTERHRIIVSDEDDLTFVKWLENRSRQDQDEWRTALDTSILLESREPALREIVIDAIPSSQWNTRPCRLTLEDAIVLLSKPLRLLVENHINDRNFLLAGCTTEQRELLINKESSSQLTFEHAGGISTMLQTLENQGNRHPSEKITVGAIFDSDALAPGIPSAQSERVRRHCARHGFPHHQLKRRAIENYIPMARLLGWAYESPAMRLIREPKYKALLRFSPEQRAHFNMKRGFRGDASRDDAANRGNLYSSLRDTDMIALDTGFGDGLSAMFADGISESDLRRDGSWSELNALVTRLLALLR